MFEQFNELQDKHAILLVNTTKRAAKNQAQSLIGQKERILSGPGVVTKAVFKKKNRKDKNFSESTSPSESDAE